MSRQRLGWIIAWIVSVVVATAWGRAQTPVPPPVVMLATPIIVAGEDSGFRVEGRRGGVPVGKLVIRKDAQSFWAEVELGGREGYAPRPAGVE